MWRSISGTAAWRSTVQHRGQPEERGKVRVPVENPDNPTACLAENLAGNAEERIHECLDLPAKQVAFLFGVLLTGAIVDRQQQRRSRLERPSQ